MSRTDKGTTKSGTWESRCRSLSRLLVTRPKVGDPVLPEPEGKLGEGRKGSRSYKQHYIVGILDILLDTRNPRKNPTFSPPPSPTYVPILPSGSRGSPSPPLGKPYVHNNNVMTQHFYSSTRHTISKERSYFYISHTFLTRRNNNSFVSTHVSSVSHEGSRGRPQLGWDFRTLGICSFGSRPLRVPWTDVKTRKHLPSLTTLPSPS